MHAIVMAAGEGRRLRPITERWPKPILPIDGRAVVATLVRQLAEEGLGPITVVTGYLAEQVEELLAALDVRFARQPEPLGSVDAVRRALAAGAELPALVSAADTVFRPGDLAAVAGPRARGAIAYRADPGKARIEIADGRVRRVVSSDPQLPYSSAPLWLLTDGISLDDVPGPPHELAVAFQRAIDAGTPVAAVEIGPTRDLTEPTDLVLENFSYLGGR
jgi:molybdopterin-guanine dinucleotide biosynthesis protein A